METIKHLFNNSPLFRGGTVLIILAVIIAVLIILRNKEIYK